jgi:predicted metal-dependent hydrolase
MTAQTLCYGDERIRFGTAFKRRLTIHVMPGGEVGVDAPEGESLARIKRSVGKRARWISEDLQAIGRRRVALLPREYVSGESYYYLGSCSLKGTLSINPHPIKAPRRCNDYMLLHELCRLRNLDHKQEFQRLLVRHMPEWKHIKPCLDGMAEQLLVE